MPIERGADGYHHPSSSAEVAELLAEAHRLARPVRVRGAGHSEPGAIHADGHDGIAAPPDGVLALMLDRMRAVTITPEPDGEHARVDVQAGCNLGKDPYDPTGTSTWSNSLSYQLEQAGYALDGLGGISHQTVAGFLSTGSAGGSIKHTVIDDVTAIELVDGTGTIHSLTPNADDAATRELFHAAGVAMGLMGIITNVTFRVGRSYKVVGQEVTAAFDDVGIDFLGAGTNERPSLANYLKRTPYARLLWWPQNDFDRVQKWEGGRLEPTDHFEHDPFTILSRRDSLLGSLLMTLIGNADDLSVVPSKLERWYAHLEEALDGDDDESPCVSPDDAPVTLDQLLDDVRARFKRAITAHPELNPGIEDQDEDVKAVLASRPAADDDWEDWLANAITKLVELALDEALDGWSGQALGKLLRRYMPSKIDELLSFFVEDGVKRFSDSWMCALPMDNQMDDQLWDTHFTELWFPIDRAAEVIAKLRTHFTADGDMDLAYQRTRSYAVEIYAAPESPFWLSPSHAGAVVRLNPFWFASWKGSAREFFAWYWSELKPLGWRPHWGKVLPPPSDEWRAYYRQQFPKLERFLELRAQLDPKQLFVTQYWREHLGI